jgi:hypothetical protein
MAKIDGRKARRKNKINQLQLFLNKIKNVVITIPVVK